MSQAGFTLIEILIALAVTAILMTGVYAVYNAFVKRTSCLELVLEAQQNARAAIELIHGELLHVAHQVPVEGEDPVLAITKATDDTVTFRYVDQLSQKLKVTYTRDGSTLTRQECIQSGDTWTGCTDAGGGASSPLVVVDNLDTRDTENTPPVEFQYFNEFGEQIATGTLTAAQRTLIRYVKASVKLLTSSVCRSDKTPAKRAVEVTIEAKLRNLFISSMGDDETKPSPVIPTGVVTKEAKSNTRAMGLCNRFGIIWDVPTDSETLVSYSVNWSDPGTKTGGTRTYPINSLTPINVGGVNKFYVLLSPGYDSQDQPRILHTPSSAAVADAITYEIIVTARNVYNKATSSTVVSSDTNVAPFNVDVKTLAGSQGEDDFVNGIQDTTINPSKPDPVAMLNSVDGIDSQTNLSWTYDLDNNPDVIGYQIYRSVDPFVSSPIGVDGTITLLADWVAADQVLKLDATATDYIDTTVMGCYTYYYAIAPVSCDTSLITDESAGAGEIIYNVNAADLASTTDDYAIAYGDADAVLPGIAADIPTPGVTDTSPSDLTAPEPPTLQAIAGWKRVFLLLSNPLEVDSPDFDHSKLYVKASAGGVCGVGDYPAVQPDGSISSGSPVPVTDTRGEPGEFESRGAISPPPTHSYMCDTGLADCGMSTAPVLPELNNETTYCYVAVSYDKCGNPNIVENSAQTFATLCSDDPAGHPGDGSIGGLFWPTGATPISVSGCDAAGGIGVTVDTMDHTYSTGYFDGAKYLFFVKPGDATEFSTRPNPKDAAMLAYANTWYPAPIKVTWTITSATMVSGLVDGETYSVGVTATDCAFDNDVTTTTYSDYLTKENITLGFIDRDVKCEGVGTCGNNNTDDRHREVITGVDIADTSGGGDGSSTPATALTHDSVTLFLNNNSLGSMTIDSVKVDWNFNSDTFGADAYLTGIKIGGGRSTVAEVVTDFASTRGGGSG
ncbi:MAG: prepilin-type N-terminal cleavage/methylation domain-containing protein, partial [Deltaproteobacteria bacterium]|nr:prepilin-type N-terminal cleavage/methylation domain-containing protein [Deltaproteobacteria bacterium]